MGAAPPPPSLGNEFVALTIWQPWASLIIEGRKSIELRNWHTHHRGPLLICAGMKHDSRGDAFGQDYPRGVAIGLVDLVDIRTATPQDAKAACVLAPDYRLAWVLANPRPITPFPVTGQMGLFRVKRP